MIAILFASHPAAAQTPPPLHGTAAEEEFGRSLSCTLGGLLIGSPHGELTAEYPQGGFVALYSPLNAQTPLLKFSFPNGAFQSLFGFSSTFIGDVITGDSIPQFGSDGTEDFAVGAPNVSHDGPSGEVYLYNPRSSLSQLVPAGGVVSLQAIYFDSGAWGYSVALIADQNQDGVPDLAVGSPDTLVGDSFNAGRVDIVDLKGSIQAGGTQPIASDFSFFNGANAGDRVGAAIAPYGGDLLIGGTHQVYVFSTVLGLLGSVSSSDLGDRFGSSISQVGDVNNDGFIDFVVGAPQLTSPTGGRAVLYGGAGGGTPTELCTVGGGSAQGSFGSSVAGIGDINGDGQLDFAVGNPDGGATGGGEVQIFSFVAPGNCRLIRTDPAPSSTELKGTVLSRSFAPGQCSLNPIDDSLPDYASTSANFGDLSNAGSVTIGFGEVPTPTPTATPTATPQAAPSQATMNFTIFSNGQTTLNNSYDRKPGSTCQLTVYARVTAGTQRFPVLNLLNRQVSDRSIVVRTRRAVPKAQYVDGQVPVVHMLTRTRCGNKTIDSRVFSRYTNCGAGSGVAIDDWQRALIASFRSATVSARK